MPVATTPLRIAVLGAGRIGSTFAFFLARGGHEVTVIARPGSERLRQLQRAGAIVDHTGARAEVRIADALDERVPYDLVIVTLLAHQIDAVLPALQRCAATRVQFMFNTFDPERFLEAMPAERCSFGMPFVQANFEGDGVLRATVGAGGQKTLMDDPRSVEVFNAADLPATLERDMPLWLRCHAPLCVAFESISVAAVRRGRGASWQEARTVAQGLRASFRLIAGLGYHLYPSAKRRIDASPVWLVAAFLWFVSRIRSFRELLATGEAECEALVASMLAAAPQAKPRVSTEAIAMMAPRALRTT